ncbi:MAG TPA: LysM peptidoglycan-binding domain-containing protein [Ilumatobacteraceae bacterium]|nr:LysM peptidoglycan-binding domain-containing protein [Ilumatobacteraceae bacterium]
MHTYAVVVPARLRHEPAEPVPTTTVYLRRRLLVGMVLLAVVVAVFFGAGSVLANRGGAPASTSAVRPASSYVAQPGDTMWSIAASHRGSSGQSDYVDALVELNGGAALQVGQVVLLP